MVIYLDPQDYRNEKKAIDKGKKSKLSQYNED